MDASRIYVSAPSNRNLPKFEQLGCTTTNDNYSLVYNYKCSIIFLCVKPHHITPETHIFKLVTVKHSLIIMSAVAGMTLEALYDNCFTNGIKYENCCIYRKYRLFNSCFTLKFKVCSKVNIHKIQNQCSKNFDLIKIQKIQAFFKNENFQTYFRTIKFVEQTVVF